ncbi:MAG TPA: peptidylprolyl isomerase [Bryobacteraceae bacterium]|jgi:parvulin-like peptidyl-prolyl isomerase|nr:peptidylprolyl isomerase [Bryobacteraceae bacterium]
MLSRVLPVFLAVSATASAEIKVIEQIVAKVNGDIITSGELERSRQALEADLKQQKVPEAKMQQMLKEREADALKDQIDQLLLVQKAKELSINVDAEITRELADIQIQNKITDPDKFRLWVQEQSGMSYEDLKQQMKNRALTQRVIRQEVGGRITIPKSELLKYYEDHKNDFVRQEQVFLREIFISSVGKSPEQVAAAEKRAKDILARAKKGEKFPELARDTSDADSAKNFGEIGWFKKADLNPSLQFLFKEKKGFITDVIKTENGFVIFRLDERHEAGLAPFEEVENEVTEKLYVPRMQPKVREYLTKLREQAFLEIRAGYVDSGAAPGKDTSWRDPAQLKPETTTKEEVAARRRKRLLGIIPRKSAKPASESSPAKSGETPAVQPPTVPAGSAIPNKP